MVAHQFPESVTHRAAPTPWPMSLSSILTSGTRASTTVIGYVDEADEDVSLEFEMPQVPLRNDHFLFEEDARRSPVIDDPEKSEPNTE